MNPVWACLTGTLTLNYVRHKLGLSTLCSSGRKVIPAWLFLVSWATLTGWIIPHFCQWKFRRYLRF